MLRGLPLPASKMNKRLPATTAVQGPARRSSGNGEPAPHRPTCSPSGSSVTAVISPPMFCASMAGGTFIFDQSRRRMVSTADTSRPWVRPLYSVTIITSPLVSVVSPV